jgi:diaminopimelate epimerase
VTLQMSEPRDMRLNLNISAAGQTFRCHYIDSGVPHVVIPMSDIAKVDVRTIGSAVRHHANFAPRGANVNFFEKRGDNQIAIRTYERGVEDETLACGTGVVASALLFAATEGAASPVRVLVKGGDELQVGFDKLIDRFTNVTLSGPADFVFEGSVEV